jgi:ribosomal protein S18 acetylase RimI-like enzyme
VSEVTIRPAQKSDASDIALLVNIATHGGIAAGWAADDKVSETYDPIEIGRTEMLKDDTNFNWRNAMMAESDDEIVGMMLGYRKADKREAMPTDLPRFLVPIIELETEAIGTWFVSMLGVHLGWRGKGIGGRLLDVADRKRTEMQARGVSLIVEDANEGARRLYERRGFAVRDRRAMVVYPDGSRPPGKDWLLMVKE